ncbi:MAG: phosphoribosylformylglycinamidine synthase subunit PurQ [Spirochaetia bacterium]|jgi:phosphoribosylformylglycinamidine synthase|nr:phosphoribosylformylglycinamidine synthase subunit PurQ [Spirochaetia bacterium]
MSKADTVKTAVITGYGINADRELERAFIIAGSDAQRIHIQDLIENPALLKNYHILAFPGGFSFGDHIGSGLVFAHLFKKHLKEELESFINDGKLIIGICNGFQVLVKMGVLPNFGEDWSPDVSLIHNNTGLFENSWLTVSFNNDSKCIWTKGLDEMDVPIRHGEGRFITSSENVLDKIEEENLVALRYLDRNPNGSVNNIAGLTDRTGRILGLMPHPEAFLCRENHPGWASGDITEGAGLKIFKNGVQYVKNSLCR